MVLNSVVYLGKVGLCHPGVHTLTLYTSDQKKQLHVFYTPIQTALKQLVLTLFQINLGTNLIYMQGLKILHENCTLGLF